MYIEKSPIEVNLYQFIDQFNAKNTPVNIYLILLSKIHHFYDRYGTSSKTAFANDNAGIKLIEEANKIEMDLYHVNVQGFQKITLLN